MVITIVFQVTMRGSRGVQGVRTKPEKSQKYRVSWHLSNTGPDPLKNHKAAKPAFNVETSPAGQQNAISMAFRWWVDDGPVLVVFGTALLSSAKKIVQFGPPLTKLS